VDHEKLRQNYLEFKEKLPTVQAYFAVKANSDSDIIKTMYDMGASFDVASFQEFMKVYNNIKHLPGKERQQYIWDNIIYANTIKPASILRKLNVYQPLVTFDNLEELKKIKKKCSRCPFGFANSSTEYWFNGRTLQQVRGSSRRSSGPYGGSG